MKKVETEMENTNLTEAVDLLLLVSSGMHSSQDKGSRKPSTAIYKKHFLVVL